MVWVRGVNVYPTAVEAVVRRFPEVVEYRCTVSTRECAAPKLTVEVELQGNATDTGGGRPRWARPCTRALGLTVPVRAVAAGTLPRFELKARRFVVDGRDAGNPGHRSTAMSEVKLSRIANIMLGARPNLARSVAFYHETLGLDIRFESPGFAFLDGGGRDPRAERGPRAARGPGGGGARRSCSRSRT